MSKMIDQLEDARVIVKQRQQKPSLKQFCKRMLTYGKKENKFKIMKNIQNSLTKYWKVPAPDHKQNVNCFFLTKS